MAEYSWVLIVLVVVPLFYWIGVKRATARRTLLLRASQRLGGRLHEAAWLPR